MYWYVHLKVLSLNQLGVHDLRWKTSLQNVTCILSLTSALLYPHNSQQYNRKGLGSCIYQTKVIDSLKKDAIYYLFWESHI